MPLENSIRKLTIGPFCSNSGGANHITRIVVAFIAVALTRFGAAGAIGL